MKRIMTTLVAAILLIASPALAIPTTIDFERLADSDQVTNQFSGLIFTNATTITAGITLNKFELPPHSGVNVVIDDGGPITIDFATPQDQVSGFFTYSKPLTLTALDALNNTVDTMTSAFSSNLALSGDIGSSPNEPLSVAFTSGISHVTIAGDPAGTSFALDDLTFTTVPEPSTLLLLIIGLCSIAGWKGLRRLRNSYYL